MVFNIEPHERKVFEVISRAAAELGYPVYVVGGYVRDRLLARPSKDMDIVCVGSGIRLAQNVAALLRPIPRVTVYKRFGTAMLKHRDMEIEFVGARKESYRSDSRKPTVEEGSLEDDQNRRDFTINALAASLNEEDYGSIIDPFDGLEHLEAKLIKTPLEPGKTFSDDPLRMMRAIRFATQLGFSIDPETFQAIGKYRNRINIISRERITTEFNKIIEADEPSVGFKLLFDTGLLQLVFPEVAALQGDMPQGARKEALVLTKTTFTIPSRCWTTSAGKPTTSGCGGLPCCTTLPSLPPNALTPNRDGPSTATRRSAPLWCPASSKNCASP